MNLVKKLLCILTALLLFCAMALPAFAEGETHYDEHDAALLRAFFEQEDPNGVKNGDKLFAHYDPDDPATWDGYMEFAEDNTPKVVWDENGKVYMLGLGLEYKDLYGKLDVSGMEELAFLECGMNKLSEVDCSGCAKLETIELSQNELEKLDLTGCASLEILNIAMNKIDEIDLGDCRYSLTRLRAGSNSLTDIDFSGMADLEYADVSHNMLTSVNVPEDCAKLDSLDCQANEITEAVINANIKEMLFSGNPLVSLDVTAAPDFLELDVANCPLRSLYMSFDGNPVSIVADGHGTFEGYIVNNGHDYETGGTHDALYLTGVPEEGCEYMGLFVNGDLLCGLNENYVVPNMLGMSIKAVFNGGEPDPTEPAPTEPTPTDPAPSEPAATEPAPTEPNPTETSATEPAPADTPNPPMTGVASIASLGFLLLAAGAGAIVAIRRKERGN